MRLLKENEEGYGVIVEWNTSSGCSGFVSNEIKNDTLLKEYDDMSKKSGTLFINCILQKNDTKNANGRFYPRDILEREDNKYQHLITEGRALGETDHPDTTFISLKSNVISHRVVKSWWEGNTLHGVLEILTSRAYNETGAITCQGDFIAMLLEKGVKLGISSRGIGSLKNVNGKNTVQKDFELICYDIVSTPSTPNAFLYPNKEVKLKENKEIENSKVLKTNDLENKLKKFLK